ncbi:MAG: peptidoglycan-binding domain-containing protein [Ilumatobacteraceae bacterium]
MRECQDGQLGNDTSLVRTPWYTGPNPLPMPSNGTGNQLTGSTIVPTTLAPTTVPMTTSTVASTPVSPSTTLTPTTTSAAGTTDGSDGAPSPTPAAWDATTWPGLRLGSTGEYVHRAQRALKSRGYQVTDTGTFDEATRQAVWREQSKYSSLPTTGSIDWATANHLGTVWPRDRLKPIPDGSGAPTTVTTTTMPATTTTVRPTTTVAPTTTIPVTTTVAPTTTTTTPGGAPSPIPSVDGGDWQPLRVGSTGEYVRRAQRAPPQWLLRRARHGRVRRGHRAGGAKGTAALPSLADTGTIDWATANHLGMMW